MSTIDITILVLLAIGAFRGFRKGFLLEVVGIAALILGLVGAMKLLDLGMEFLSQHFDIGETLLPYVTFLLLFVLIIIGVNFIGRLVKRVLDLTLLGTMDNLAGALVGLFKWAIGISFILWATSFFGMNLIQEEEQSELYNYIAALAPWFIEVVQSFMPLFSELPSEDTWV